MNEAFIGYGIIVAVGWTMEVFNKPPAENVPQVCNVDGSNCKAATDAEIQFNRSLIADVTINLEVAGHDEKWKETVSIFRAGDRAGALFIFQWLAKEGCSPALVEIGNIYEKGGGGVDKNLNEAIKVVSHSVDVLDDPKAHLALGHIYLQVAKTNDEFLDAYYVNLCS